MSRQRTADRKLGSTRSQKRAPVDTFWEPSNAMVVGLFILVILIFFWGHISGNAFLWEDFTEAFYPFQVFAARNFSAGVIPYWNPFTFNGMPFLADLQTGIFYPGNQLMYLLSGGELSSWLAQFFIILHYLVAMLGVWRLARGLGLSQWGGALGGIVYALCGLMVAHAIHQSMVYHEAWFPWIVLFFYQGVTRRSLFHSIVAGLLLGITMLTGHPQLTLYIVFFLFCLTIFLLVRDLRVRGEGDAQGSLGTGIITAALPIVIGAGIFAIQLLPSMELAGLSERAAFTYEQTLEGTLGVGQLLTLIVPKFFGVTGPTAAEDMQFWYRPEPHYFWETAIYIGVVTLILAAVGLASRRLGGLGWFLGGMGLFGLLYALGDNFVIHPIFGKLPLFSTFRIPPRMTLYLALGGAVLAAAGLDRLLRGGEQEDRAKMAGLLTGGFVALIGLLSVSGVLLGLFDAPPNIGDATAATGITALLVGAAATGVIWGRVSGKMASTASAAILLLLAIVDMFAFGMGYNNSPVDPQKDIYERNDMQYAALKADPPAKLFRVKMREGGFMLMQRNQGMYSDIMLYEGYNPLLLRRRVPPAADPERAFDMLNIQYDVRIDQATGQAGLVNRPTAFPHVRMMYDARVVDSAGAYNGLKSGQIDVARTVLLEKNPGITLDGSGSGTATVTSYDASAIGVNVVTDKPGILLMSEIWYPAWKVYVDGNPAELLVADYSLRGVAVPAGTHTVEFRFESGAFGTGVWITVVTLVAAIAGAVLTGMKLRSRKGDGPVAAEPVVGS